MNVSIRNAQIAHIEDMAVLISEQNRLEHRHVGYCGVDASEIRHTLQHDFSQDELHRNFRVAFFADRMVGLLGFDVDSESGTAEIWGPFACVDTERREEIVRALWNGSLAGMDGDVKKLQGFYHRQNIEAAALMKQVGARFKSRHMTLALQRDQYSKAAGHEGITELEPTYHEAFSRLHDAAFPDSYAMGATLLNNREGEYRLLGCIRGGELLGYACVSGNRTFAEGAVEFLATLPKARGQGVGTRLLLAALELLFKEFAPGEVRLTVSGNNEAAIRLYLKCGFELREELDVYDLPVLPDAPAGSLDF